MNTGELINNLIDKSEKQDRFILELFNDKRIDDSIKVEWMDEYNSLKINIEKIK